jgi:hypothetical protein
MLLKLEVKQDPNIAAIHLCSPIFAKASFLQVLAVLARSAWQPEISSPRLTVMEAEAQISSVSIPKRLMWWDTHYARKCMLA